MSEGLNISLDDVAKTKPIVTHGSNTGELVSIAKEQKGYRVVYKVADINAALSSMRELVKDLSIQHAEYNYNFSIDEYNYKLEAIGAGAIVTIEEIYEEAK